MSSPPTSPRPQSPEPARRLQISPAQSRQTLAAVLREELDGLPWNQARELCRRGKVRVNGTPEKDGSRRLQAGDEVVFDPRGPRLRAHVLDDAAIVYCDPQVVVVDKPAGLLSVAFERTDKNTLADRLRFWLRRNAESHSDAAMPELGVVQRLDKDTTGLLVFARTLTAKRHLQQQLAGHSIERRYLALVHGELTTAATIESDLLRDRGDGLRGSWGHFRRPQGELPKDAQHAITHVSPLEALRRATLVECRLETGRQHQIRIHLSERGHPLLGETVYIRDYTGKPIAAPRPMLHAAVLGFVHPGTGQTLRFEREPPADFATALAGLRTKTSR
jgi:23S rRNA pseudouridine1911/1915/1917 synthase